MNVGASVGLTDGNCVGLSVGLLVGTGVGLKVGDVGAFDGDNEGDLVGDDEKLSGILLELQLPAHWKLFASLAYILVLSQTDDPLVV